MHFIPPCVNISKHNEITSKEVKVMRDGIHPNYDTCTVRCACGATYETKSTKSELKVDICSKFHPFYTGKQKLVDTGGRVDRFNKRYSRNG